MLRKEENENSIMRAFISSRHLFFFCLTLGTLVFAQEPISIGGKVTDAKGFPIPGATVRVFSGEKGKTFEALTEFDGAFKIQGIPAGVYQVTVEIVGFLKATKEAVDTSAGVSRTLTVQLESLPRPPRPNVPRPAAGQQAQDTAAFQAAEVTDLPGLNQFQQDPAQGGGDAATITSRQENLILISGNSASLDAGNISDPGFRGQMMDTARRMGFQLLEFGPGGEGGPGGMGGAGTGGDLGGGGRGRGGAGGAGWASSAWSVEEDAEPIFDNPRSKAVSPKPLATLPSMLATTRLPGNLCLSPFKSRTTTV
jgi:hypothetical protein